MVERLDDDAIDIGLTKERIETLVRSRLRAARLYETGISTPFLYVNVLVVAEAYSAAFGLVKEVTDHNSKQMDSGLARTWYLGGIGTHGQDAGFILQHVSEYTDHFIDEYLRVNAEAC